MDMQKKDKPAGVMCSLTKDGRVYLHLSCASTLARAKVAFVLGVLALFLGYVLSPTIFGESNALRRRVRELEARMSKRVQWLLQHREHMAEHLKGNSDWAPTVHPDGRRHLLSHPDGISKLAEALAPNTELPAFDDHYLCGAVPVSEGELLKKKIALAAISWRAPKSLRNSMESWRAGGLLDVVDERMIFLNSPTDEDVAIAREFDFDVYTTDEQNGNVLVGPAVSYLTGNSSADYILFMEKDFVLSSPSKDVMMREMWHGVAHLGRGVEVYRLRGKTDFPAEGMPDCCAKADPPNCPFNSQWQRGADWGAHQDWCVARARRWRWWRWRRRLRWR
jgi:hypothetical protein